MDTCQGGKLNKSIFAESSTVDHPKTKQGHNNGATRRIQTGRGDLINRSFPFETTRSHLIPNVPLGYFFTPSADTTSLGLTRNTSPRIQPSPGPRHFAPDPPPPLAADGCELLVLLPLPDVAFAAIAVDDLLLL